MSNRRRLARKRVGGWFTTESHLEDDGSCTCSLRRVELYDDPAPRCRSCGQLIDMPLEVPLPADVPPGATGPLGFRCFCGADPVDLIVRVVA